MNRLNLPRLAQERVIPITMLMLLSPTPRLLNRVAVDYGPAVGQLVKMKSQEPGSLEAGNGQYDCDGNGAANQPKLGSCLTLFHLL